MHIIVAGAGIVGVSCAIWLQRSGHSVTLIDRVGPASGTSHGNAGVLAAGAVIPVTTPSLFNAAPGMLMLLQKSCPSLSLSDNSPNTNTCYWNAPTCRLTKRN